MKQTIKDIKAYLINRYLHGYTVNDAEYVDLKKQLYEKIKSKLKGGNKIQDLLENDLGEYNVITASVYLELAAEYLRKTKHQRPTITQVLALI